MKKKKIQAKQKILKTIIIIIIIVSFMLVGLNLRQCVYLFIHIFIYSFVYLFVYLFVFLFLIFLKKIIRNNIIYSY